MQKCPQCAEQIQDAALVCRHCGHVLTDQEKALARRERIIRQVGIGVCAVAAIAFVSRCDTGLAGADGNSSMEALGEWAARQDAALPEPAPAQVRLDRFRWEGSGDTYCRASAKLTNTSGRALDYLRITMQFVKGKELLGSDFSYADLTHLPEGSSTTWSAMYPCPGVKATVELTGTSHQGSVAIIDP